MANTVNFAAPTDYTVEAADIERRRKLAEMLQAQAMEPLQSPATPAGGFAIRTSPYAGIAKMLQGYAGAMGQKRASEEAKALGERRQTGLTQALMQYQQGKQGIPAQSIAPDPQEAQQSADQGTPEVPTANIPAQAGNPKAAIMGGLASQYPELRTIAGMDYTAQQKLNDPYTLAPGATRYGPDGKPIVTAPVKPESFTLAPGATRFGPDGKVITAMPKDDELMRAIEAAGLDPNSTEAKALFASRANKIATHAPPTRVNVSQNVSTEKKYGEQFATKIAGSDSDMRDAAIKAPQLADRANQIKKILADGKVITGFGADFRLQADKAIALAGFKGAGGEAANTETLASGLAQNTLDAIKASGLGSGNGFSNADRDFLEKAVGGKVNLEKQTIDRLANLAHKAAEQTALRWSTRVKEIPASALEGTGIKTDPVTVSPLHGSKPPAAGGAPAGVDAKIWAAMTPEERALWK